MSDVIQGTVLSHSSGKYAGFWLRFVALIIDSILVGIVVRIAFLFIPFTNSPAVINMDLRSYTELGNLIQMAVTWLYFAGMESSEHQATFGKLALGLKVTDEHGKRVTFLRALGRNVAKFISGIILCIGFIMAAFTKKKQALHDIIAGCLVVRR